MSKSKFERNKTHVNVGTIGHVDHGKTTLTAALTVVSNRLFGSELSAFDMIDKAPEIRLFKICNQVVQRPARGRRVN